MKIHQRVSVAATAFLLSATAGAASITLAELPYRDPGQLEEMMRLSDAQYQEMLNQRWNEVENVLYQHIPKSTEIYPASRSFYGPWKSCLQNRTVAACREHMAQLISLQKKKAGLR